MVSPTSEIITITYDVFGSIQRCFNEMECSPVSSSHCVFSHFHSRTSMERVSSCLCRSHSSPPPLPTILTTSGWPLLTHHGRPLSPAGFSSRAKSDNRHRPPTEGCEVSHRNRVVPRFPRIHFYHRVCPRTPMGRGRREAEGWREGRRKRGVTLCH